MIELTRKTRSRNFFEILKRRSRKKTFDFFVYKQCPSKVNSVVVRSSEVKTVDITIAGIYFKRNTYRLDVMNAVHTCPRENENSTETRISM